MDALRGFIIVVMALDHANVFIARAHPPPEMWVGSFPSYASALPFLTRWVTHLAAPGFFFLMGAGMMLFAAGRRRIGWSEGAITRHLMLRGLLLVALQFLIENRAWALGEGSRFPVYFGVLFGLGATMVIGSLLLRLNSLLLIATSLALILATQMFATLWNGPVTIVMQILFLPGSSGNLLVYYPPLAWLGLVAFGMAFGNWLQDRDRGYRAALFIGAGLLFFFVLIRLWGGFGNIRPAAAGDWISFLNVVKYPPSMVFIFLTLGIDLLLFASFARIPERFSLVLTPLTLFGSTALFFYLLHLYLYATIGLTVAPRGIGIPAMYPYWLLGLVILAPLCFLYGKFKRQQPPDSLLRFF